MQLKKLYFLYRRGRKQSAHFRASGAQPLPACHISSIRVSNHSTMTQYCSCNNIFNESDVFFNISVEGRGNGRGLPFVFGTLNRRPHSRHILYLQKQQQ